MKNNYNILRNWLSAIMITSVLFNSIGQSSEKKPLRPEDYTKWHELKWEKISPDGKWIAYTLAYDQGEDTLFVKGIDSNTKSYTFPLTMGRTFSGNGKWFFTEHPKNGLALQNLISGQLRWIQGANKGRFLAEGRHLIVTIKEQDGQSLLLLDLQSGQEQKITKIKEYAISPDEESIAYVSSDNAVNVIWLNQKFRSKNLVKSSDSGRSDLVWNDNGDAIAFLEALNEEKEQINFSIYFIQDITTNEKSYIFSPKNHLPDGEHVAHPVPFAPALLIAPDNKHVFFYSDTPFKKPDGEPLVEVWDAQAPLEYQAVRYFSNNIPRRPKLTLWSVEKNAIMEVATDSASWSILSPKRNFAFIFNQCQYVPKNGGDPKSDIWYKDLNTGEKQLILEKYFWTELYVGVSPNDRYFAYFKDSHWWVYDVLKKTHRNLTKNLGVYFAGINSYSGKRDEPFENYVYWSTDSDFFIVHDQMGVWLLDPQGKNSQRVGLPSTFKTRLRVVINSTGDLKQGKNHFDFYNNFIDLSKGLLLQAFGNDKSSGYYLWKPKEGLKELIHKSAKVSNLQKVANTDTYLVTEQTAERSPQLVTLSKEGKKQKVVLRTNTHQEKYQWTQSELIAYTNTKGEPLQGTLYYPARYDPTKKYPMVVHIYEKQSQNFHEYHFPSLYSSPGSNPVNYTSDGYFVFYPDISYELGKPGYSAVDCVESAVKAVLHKGMVDSKTIGLIGHSFGGYQTSFIITQSHMFAAAVAGTAPTDFISNSLGVEKGRSRMWFFDSYQGRMGKMLYDNFNGYLENSPIAYADKVQTPLLSWTGKEDYHVGPEQSMEFHMALRNLNKRNVFLQYPKEGHVLLKPEAQKDLNIKCKAWFDHYLKGIPIPKETGL